MPEYSGSAARAAPAPLGAATRSLAQAGYQVVPIPPGYTWTVITALPDMDDPEECTGNLATAFGSLYLPTADQRDEW